MPPESVDSLLIICIFSAQCGRAILSINQGTAPYTVEVVPVVSTILHILNLCSALLRYRICSKKQCILLQVHSLVVFLSMARGGTEIYVRTLCWTWVKESNIFVCNDFRLSVHRLTFQQSLSMMRLAAQPSWVPITLLHHPTIPASGQQRL